MSDRLYTGYVLYNPNVKTYGRNVYDQEPSAWAPKIKAKKVVGNKFVSKTAEEIEAEKDNLKALGWHTVRVSVMRNDLSGGKKDGLFD